MARALGWILGGVGALVAVGVLGGSKASSSSSSSPSPAGDTDDGRPLLVLGDSHAVGLAAALRKLFPGRTIHNLSKGGTASRATQTATDGRHFVILSIGTNDIGASHAETVKSILRVLGPYARNAAREGKLFYLLPPMRMVGAQWNNVRTRVAELNAELAGELVPNARFFFSQPPETAELGPDGLHFSPAGYKAIALAAMHALAPGGKAPPPPHGPKSGLLPDGSLDPAFRARSVEIASATGIPLDMLLAVMHFETGGTMRSDIRNAAGSGATGLIQFMPKYGPYKSATDAVGKSTDELAQMSALRQLDYVEHHFKRFGSFAGRDPRDAYLAVFSPGMLGKPDDFAFYVEGRDGAAYTQNRGLDRDKDGAIRVGEVRRVIEGARSQVRAKGWA